MIRTHLFDVLLQFYLESRMFHRLHLFDRVVISSIIYNNIFALILCFFFLKCLPFKIDPSIECFHNFYKLTSILLTTSSPSITFPNTTCLLSNLQHTAQIGFGLEFKKGPCFFTNKMLRKNNKIEFLNFKNVEP